MAITLTGTVQDLQGTGINGVTVEAFDAQNKSVGKVSTKSIAGSDGSFSLLLKAAVKVGDPVVIKYESPFDYAPTTGPKTKLTIKTGQHIHVQALDGTNLPSAIYQPEGCQISGTVQREVATNGGSSWRPLADVQLRLFDNTGAKVGDAKTDGQGNFCFFVDKVDPATQPFTVQLPEQQSDGTDLLLLDGPNQIPVLLADPDFPFQLPDTIKYQLALAQVIGEVDDGRKGLEGVPVELINLKTGTKAAKKTDSLGFYRFTNIRPGGVELRFPDPFEDKVKKRVWQLEQPEAERQSFDLAPLQVQQANPTSYRPEERGIVWTVTVGGQLTPGVLVELRDKSDIAIAQKVSDRNGKVNFDLTDLPGEDFKVAVYTDPRKTAGPLVSAVQVHSITYGTTECPVTPTNGAGAGAPNAKDSVVDLQSYPVLTEEVPSAAVSRPPAVSTGALAPLGQTAENAIRDVLSWRTKPNDPKSFVMALNQSFALKDVEGHTEFTWTPRSYTVQTDLGAVTGAQASIYTRAKVALDQSLPLLDGLYPLLPEVLPEDLESVRVVVRGQFTELVNEFGVEGGPRVPRVDQLLLLLLGDDVSPPGPGAPTGPEDLDRGSLFILRNRFGLKRNFINTIDDEQNFTNYLILVDYVLGLNQSGNSQKQFFTRNGVQGAEPYFGTQLVLLSRALDVVAQSVQDVYFTLDSVFLGAAERQTISLDFSGATVTVPVNGTPQSFTFPTGTSSLFVAELLDWVQRASSDELPRLLQDAGKDGLPSLTSILDNLRKFVRAALIKQLGGAQDSPGLPPGYRTPRVQRALQELADQLDETLRLASQINPPRFPVFNNAGAGSKRAVGAK
jgi:hypothetical protein